MAEALCQPLYPADAPRLRAALAEARGTSGFLRLAQEYQVAFGTSALNDRIRALAPDTDYRPGSLHHRLLRLPWADVFSTNWDTLLERARDDVFNRSYDVIRTTDEIPFTQRPRIVKLHGSFPAHHPFIFTEDDYRTYPIKHAPFVNLVQQSMMETLFCLIGFSGDDPNFLHWAGWVRDNLGDTAPRIYLIGWLEMSNHRRRMLEARNVMPIDLAALPAAAGWPVEHRHRYAVEWFVAAMERGERYNPSHWPEPPRGVDNSPNPLLGEIPPVREVMPESMGRCFPSDQPGPHAALMLEVEKWRHNRKLYPGWLIAPEHIRNGIWERFRSWLWITRDLSEFTELEKLQILTEMGWLFDICLFPLPRTIEDLAFNALCNIDFQQRKVGNEIVDDREVWADLVAMSEKLALSLCRNARHAADRSRFDRAVALLAERSRHDRVLQNALNYEACLWDNASGDLRSLMGRLNAWTSVQGDALASLRKACLLAELREDAPACELLEQTLATIRRGRRRDIDDIAALSMESWALHLALAYEHRWAITDDPTMSRDQPAPFERWRILASLDCDAWAELHALLKTLQLNKGPTPEISERRGFDLNHVATTRHFDSNFPENRRAAYAALMLSEFTALPPAARHMTVLAPALGAAARVLADDEPWVVASWAVRMHLSASDQDLVINRRWVAQLPEETAVAIRDALLRRAAFMLDRASGTGKIDDVNDAASCLELLSRVAVRLSSADLTLLATEALSYHSRPILSQYGHFLGPPLNNLLRRVLEALSKQQLVQLLPLLFDAQLPIGQDGPEILIDPVQALPDWFDARDADTANPAWRGIVDKLVLAVSETGPRRIAAVARLQRLYEWQILSELEARRYAERLWAENHLTPQALPAETNFYPWATIHMPERTAGQIRHALATYLDSLLGREGNNDQTLIDLANLLGPLAREQFEFPLGQPVVAEIRRRIIAWATAPGASGDNFQRAFSSFEKTQQQAVFAVATLVAFISPDQEIAEALWTKRDALEGQDYMAQFIGALYPALARLSPIRATELLSTLRLRLHSDKRVMSDGALTGLFRWLDDSNAPDSDAIRVELDEAVRAVGLGLAAGRHSLLGGGLNLAVWLFRSGPTRLRNLIAGDCDTALWALLATASYDAPHADLDIPAIRAACVRLAIAMDRDGRGALSGVAAWLSIAPEDPLPEVRHAGTSRGDIGGQ